MAIEIVAFTWQCRIAGAIPLADDRLTDMLNAVTRIVIRNATIEDLDNAEAGAGDVQIDAGHLVAVVASGRTGVASRRLRTRVQRVSVDLDRYVVTGLLHSPAAEPELPASGRPDRVLAGRDVLVPLTDAVITYDRAGRSISEEHDTILINRSLATWVDAIGDGEAPAPPARWSGRTRNPKDMTGLPTS
jgi:hypothetical protein